MNRKFKYYFVGTLFLLLQNLPAQSLQRIWEQTYDAGDFEYPAMVITSSDTALLICGNKINTVDGNSDILLIKTDSFGNILWQNLYGGNGDDVSASAFETPDKNYLIIGSTNSFSDMTADYDIYLLKLTMNGDTLWTKTVGSDSTYERAYSSIITSDNKILVVGTVQSFSDGIQNMLVIKMDQNGNIIWKKTFGGEVVEIGESVLETDDNGFLITGETTSFGIATPFYTNVYLVRTDANGDSLWTRYYGNTWYDYSRSIIKADDNSYIVSGWYATNGAEVSDFYALRIQDNGDNTWTRLYGGGGYEYSYDIVKRGNNDFILIGNTNSSGAGSYDIYFVNINSNGDTIWTKTFGSSVYENAKGALRTDDGNYIVYGQRKPFSVSNGSDILLVKLDLNGTSDIEENNNSLPSSFILEQNYPNPFNSSTKIKFSIPPHLNPPFAKWGKIGGLVTLKVYDVLGSEVATLVNEYKPAGSYEVAFDGSSLSSGIYFYRLQAGGFVEAKKMLLMK